VDEGISIKKIVAGTQCAPYSFQLDNYKRVPYCITNETYEKGRSKQTFVGIDSYITRPSSVHQDLRNGPACTIVFRGAWPVQQ